jgi:hypothetical protein
MRIARVTGDPMFGWTVSKHLLLAFALIANAAMAQEEGWVDGNGRPVPNSDAMKSIAGFGGWLIVTPDADWEEKWLTPAEQTPRFSEAEEVRIGGRVTMLMFFINPKADENGHVSIGCAVRIVRPNGFVSNVGPDICVSGMLPGNPRHVQLAPTIIGFVGEETDPLGEWVIEYTISDLVRGVDVPLRTSFRLVE